tara:strand:+ start:2789 stop:3685 length:897 start_codon:yes stop_codon:yes gene_type:complete
MSLSDVDLNIDNYDVDDLLDLFKIDSIDNESNLAKAKIITLKMHPDKSGLDKEYFLFFSKAYKTLYQLYIIQDKSRQKGQTIDYENYKETINKDNKIILDKISKKKVSNCDFNKWFNQEFESMKLNDAYIEHGYGEWMLENDDNDNNDIQNETSNSLDAMHNNIEKKRQQLCQIVKKQDIHEYNDGAYCDIGNNAPENYSSEIFSNLAFQDLKQAHTETVMAVDEKSALENRMNYDAIKSERGKKITPISEKEAINMLGDKQKMENKNNVERMYKLIKQQEEVEKKNIEWWKKYKLIK